MENLFLPKEAVGQLFDLQGEDALLGQLQHQIKTLPEREKLMSLNQIRNEVEGLIDVRKNAGLEQVKKEKRLELELSSIETSLTEADEKLYSGVITTEKEVKREWELIHHRGAATIVHNKKPSTRMGKIKKEKNPGDRPQEEKTQGSHPRVQSKTKR